MAIIDGTTDLATSAKERNKRVKVAKQAASTDMFEQILQKQQEVSCKRCEALQQDLLSKDNEIKKLVSERENQKLIAEDLKSSLEAKRCIINDLEVDREKLTKRVKMSHNTG